jgi:SAM-dependent methyltransferase
VSTDDEWEKWARTSPYFAVLSHARFRGELSPAARAEFFASGEAQITHVLRVIETHLAPDFSPTTALDFGCGTGRLTVPLARVCEATGEDVSPTMLDEARRNARESGVAAQFTREATGTFDLIVSFLVFQHIPVARGMEIATRLIGQLSPGGVAVLHFMVRSKRSLAVRIVNRARYRVPLLQYAVNVLRRRPLLEPPMQMNGYDLRDLLLLFADHTVHIERSDDPGFIGFTFYIRSGARAQEPSSRAGESGTFMWSRP